ncbi:two-component system, chemotaxis family, sensor kinase CheA [Desulfonatronum thiosulfatophilum]|uniref:Chemotaxis protein CheA n=1 Tax=Desulfonatronum thiosulfatophilum TaxID=617002 RepID=A0A1G6DCR0_9BACT|nr:chemotaxis protein CheA [Desulfonatronum thiosulfatophilum]SDB42899.1 two-component system, chemotaxis family, sensor kinase CheA [Desulfonatronum thiosulfatophilum]
MNKKFQIFIEECQELLTELESALLEQEAASDNIDMVHRIFRALHTIKGSAAMLGLEDVRELTNDLETLFDLVRSGQMALTPELVTLSFTYKDLLTEYLGNPENGLPADKSALVLRNLSNMMGNTNIPHKCGSRGSSEEPRLRHEESGAVSSLYHLRYFPKNKPYAALDPLDFLGQLHTLGNCEIHASPAQIPLLDVLDPLSCSTCWDVILHTDADEDSIRDLFLFLDNPEEISRFGLIDEAEAAMIRQEFARESSALQSASVEAPGQPKAASPEPAPDNANETSSEDLPLTLPETESRPSQPAPTPIRTAKDPQAASTKQAVPAGGTRIEEIASIRVSANKLDDMVDLVGQLVIVQARLKQIETDLHNPLLTSVSEEIERLSSDLRERTLSLRMLPIGSTFNRFRRLVRDLSSELGKEIELKTFGAETELDKTVIEKLSDPLVHILRNSIDHGIESAAARQSQGKPSKGVITLSAMQSAGQVRIVIQDDGGGIDPEKIYAKAVERGLARADVRPSDRDILQLIFAPGFSTAEKVTSVSGRGVGMDVVKRSLESLKGTVEIDSRPGNGTTITIGLPLTLAIIEGLLVLMADEYYVIPLSDVLECVEIQRGDDERERIAKAFDIRGELLPCLILRNWYDFDSMAPEIEQVVVVQAGNRRVGLVVDSIVGQLQTVIKGLGRVFSGMKGLSGATIMGNGDMALILDINSLVNELEKHSSDSFIQIPRHCPCVLIHQDRNRNRNRNRYRSRIRIEKTNR